MHVGLIQQFGLGENGGGPRILRALLRAQPFSWVSVCTQVNQPSPISLANGRQVWAPARPSTPLDTTRYHRAAELLAVFFRRHLRRRIWEICESEQFDVIHVVPHGPDDWRFAAEYARARGTPLVVSFHDDLRYILPAGQYQARADELGQLWRGADQVFCISKDMGIEYGARFGKRSFELVTDGVETVQPPRTRSPSARMRVYFCGLLHFAYLPNFLALLEALRHAGGELLLRGAATFDAMDAYCEHIRQLPFAADVADDFADVDLLYLPLPFGEAQRDFVRYSMSTKAISYLGSGVPIVYHGPAEGPLYRLLRERDAAILVTSTNWRAMYETLTGISARRLAEVAKNAGLSASELFQLAEQRARFLGGIERAAQRSARGAAKVGA